MSVEHIYFERITLKLTCLKQMPFEQIYFGQRFFVQSLEKSSFRIKMTLRQLYSSLQMSLK
jgi:hypothetical protein